MDSFVRLFAIYRGASRAWAAKYVYSCASLRWRFALWSTKVAFAVAATMQFFFEPHWPFFFGMMAMACLWAFCFDRSRKSAFSEQYRLYPERVRFFERDYQYLRYLEFRRRLQNAYSGDFEDALRFLGEQIETDSQNIVSSHPVMTLLVGTLLAVVGAAAGQWSAIFIVYAALATMVALFFSGMVLGMLRTRQGDLKEFKRFLLWAKHEQVDTQSA